MHLKEHVLSIVVILGKKSHDAPNNIVKADEMATISLML